MRLTKKLNIALMLVLVCLVLLIGASYAWLTISRNPEVQRIDTNIGANGSLEIALLTGRTYEDPTLITTTIGDSAVKQNVKESNESWGNVIQLSSGYGLEQITLQPARLNMTINEENIPVVSQSLLRTADFGIDGRIKVLNDNTVSTTLKEDDFTFHVTGQDYGVRAIGTISNLSSQQTALAAARVLTKTYTAAASRTAQNTWQSYGSGVVDILYRHYALGEDTFTEADAETVQNFALGMQEAAEYVDSALRQVLIGMAAVYEKNEPEFEDMYEWISDRSKGDLSALVENSLTGIVYYDELLSLTESVDALVSDAASAVTHSYYLSVNEREWSGFENVFALLLHPDKIYLGEQILSEEGAFESLTQDNVILVPSDCGVMGRIADFTGNYNAFTMWKDSISVEIRTASREEQGKLIPMQALLESSKASVGGWTRANMDDLYGFAIDLAFRCNEPSQLQLQSLPMQRVGEDAVESVTQGGGSYMLFGSENMEYDQLLTLMDTIRVGFIDDRGQVLGIAKLNLSSSSEDENGRIYAPLYLYDFTLGESGEIAIIRRSEESAIMDLPQNAPVIVSVVVWMDGDHVDNSMVSELADQSMDGILNLQFSSSADLVPSKQPIKGN